MKFLSFILVMFVVSIAHSKKEKFEPMQLSCKEISTVVITQDDNFMGKAEKPKKPISLKYLFTKDGLWNIGNAYKTKMEMLQTKNDTIQALEVSASGGNILHTIHVIDKKMYSVIKKSYPIAGKIASVSIHMDCEKEF